MMAARVAVTVKVFLENMRTKILFFDIENSPSLGWVWEKWETNVIDFKSEWHLLSFAYKWAGDRSVRSYSLPDFPLYKKDKENDRELVHKLHELMGEADILIAHNGNDFDIRKANARFAYYDLPPVHPLKSIDTKLVARKYFMFNSNSLNDLAKHLGLGEKIDTGGFDLWLGCMKGDKKSWRDMVRYNKNDVVLLEKIYQRLAPFMTNHPNINIVRDDLETGNQLCPRCGSETMQRRGWSITALSRSRRYQCVSCGGWSSGKPERIKEVEVR